MALRRSSGISIVIPTLNEERFLPRLLHDLTQQVNAPPFEVIVVDASKNSRTLVAAAGFAKLLNMACLRTDRAHPGAQRNIGALRCSHDLLLFLDADIRIPSATLAACIEAAPASHFVAAARHAPPSSHMTLRATMGIIDLLMRVAALANRGATNGDFILTDRETFEDVGGFRDDCLLGEDTDFGLRAQKRGAQYRYLRSTAIVPDGRRAELAPAPLVALEWIRSYLSVLLLGKPPKRTWFVDYPFGVWGEAG